MKKIGKKEAFPESGSPVTFTQNLHLPSEYRVRRTAKELGNCTSRVFNYIGLTPGRFF